MPLTRRKGWMLSQELRYGSLKPMAGYPVFPLRDNIPLSRTPISR